jgi:hypothetical protein
MLPRDPAHPGRLFTPNQKYAALVEACGYVRVALTGDDYVELLPSDWRAVNDYGIRAGQPGSLRPGGPGVP